MKKVLTIDEKPILRFKGRHIDIKSDGTSAGTHIKIDGKEQRLIQRFVIAINVNQPVRVESLALDLDIAP